MTYLLDGNAIAGDLFAAFGREMTDVVGKCATAEQRPRSLSYASTRAPPAQSPAVAGVTPS